MMAKIIVHSLIVAALTIGNGARVHRNQNNHKAQGHQFAAVSAHSDVKVIGNGARVYDHQNKHETRDHQFAAVSAHPDVKVSGRQLLVNGESFHIKGVCWNPVGYGGTHPNNLDYKGNMVKDVSLMKEAGINVVRTYDAVFDMSVLDYFLRQGIYVVPNVYPWGGSPTSEAVRKVNAMKGHPAILMWEVGNEWNYNGLYVGIDFNGSLHRVKEVVSLVKSADSTRPVATVYGELPSTDTLEVLKDVDIWSINSYRSNNFGDLFSKWMTLSDLPMYLGEYGADAFDARIRAENASAQADATAVLTHQINDASSMKQGGTCVGGFIFEFADEWWKDHKGRPTEHDVGGIAPGGGPWPDQTFNEEWWGLVELDRTPRPAFHAYKNVAPPKPTARKSRMASTADIRVSGRQLLVNGAPFHIKGVCWNPVGWGGTHPANLDYKGFAARDGKLMKKAGINVVRVYESILDMSVLDIFWNLGIYVAPNVYVWGGSPISVTTERVNAMKNHPAILLWEVGNEWNYNGLYVGMNYWGARERVREALALVKAADRTHPVSTVYGELPSAETLRILKDADLWAINSYRSINFGNLFDSWKSRSLLPMYLGEYGADAFDANINAENVSAQAEATTVLTCQINKASSMMKGGTCVGGMIFEFADEWWKDYKGSPWVHEAGGVAPGGGPYPDQTFNEEWWGIVDVDRKLRPAYHAYKAMPFPSAAGPGC